MNVVFVIDSKSFLPMMVTLRSLLANTSAFLHVYLFVFPQDVLSRVNERKVHALLRRRGRFESKPVDSKIAMEMSNLPLGNWHPIIYLRLFVPFYLRCEKFIYLDTDVVVRRGNDIFVEYNKPFAKECVVRGWHHLSSRASIENGITDGIYLNSGCLLIRTQPYLKMFPKQEDLLLSIEKSGRTVYPDQDFLNAAFNGKKERFENIYFQYPSVEGVRLPPLSVLIHYAGAPKP